MAFLGTADFAVPSLRACVARGDDIAVVVTQPPRPGSRGQPAPRPVAAAAAELGVIVSQPERVREPAVVDELLALGIDALIVAAYGQILPARLLEGPRRGGINVHASLLPRWRGASPVAAAVLAGDAQTGVSIMRMDAGLDTGPVYARRATDIGPGETTPELTARLAVIGAEMLVEVLDALERGEAHAEPQDEAAATLAPRLRREDGRVDWTATSAIDVDRRVRALQPWPGVTAPLGGIEVRILSGAVSDETSDAAPGSALRSSSGGVDVATASGVYTVREVQPPGKRAMDAAAFLRGRRT